MRVFKSDQGAAIPQVYSVKVQARTLWTTRQVAERNDGSPSSLWCASRAVNLRVRIEKKGRSRITSVHTAPAYSLNTSGNPATRYGLLL